MKSNSVVKANVKIESYNELKPRCEEEIQKIRRGIHVVLKRRFIGNLDLKFRWNPRVVLAVTT